MRLPNKKINAILVYLERYKSRQFVGRLYRKGKQFIFEYDKEYLYSKNCVSMGPEFPLTKRIFQSKKLFLPFADRIPSKDNPAYSEYCESVGISIDEDDPLVLLATIASRGPSSFIFVPEFEDRFDKEDLLSFRNNLGLSARDFASCFNFSQVAVTRVETGKSSGRELLKRAAIYARFPEVALYQISILGGALHKDKRAAAEKYLMDVLKKKKVKGRS